jgi:UDP-N-acetylglucosamine:LPS N-acetylglucosamine transferase
MRVLITSTPGIGHVYPVLPLARALRHAGHELLWVIAEEGEELVRHHGFAVAVAGMNVDERRATLGSRFAEIMRLPPRSRRGHFFAGLFARGAAPKTVNQLGPIFDRFNPDVVIHEIGELAAAPHAVARGLPHATVAYSGALADLAVTMVEEALVAVWATLGLAPPSWSDIAGDVYFHPFPASMGQAPTIDRVHELRPADAAGDPVDAPDWLSSFGRDRRGVYVTAGTTPIVATLAPWRATFDALASIDVDVLATIGPQFPIDDLGPLPANVRVERFVPQSLVLDRVGVVLSHGGAGTLLAAARVGVPQLTIPTWADQWENADAVAHAGAGIVLEHDQHDSASIRAALERLLHDGTYRDAAARLAGDIAAMPTASDHVTTIEQLVSPA